MLFCEMHKNDRESFVKFFSLPYTAFSDSGTARQRHNVLASGSVAGHRSTRRTDWIGRKETDHISHKHKTEAQRYMEQELSGGIQFTS